MLCKEARCLSILLFVCGILDSFTALMVSVVVNVYPRVDTIFAQNICPESKMTPRSLTHKPSAVTAIRLLQDQDVVDSKAYLSRIELKYD